MPPSNPPSPRSHSPPPKTNADNQLGGAVPSDISRSSTDSLPPPAYSSTYGNLHFQQEGIGTTANVSNDGRVNISINQGQTRRLSALLVPALRSQLSLVSPKELAEQTGAAPGYPEAPAHLKPKKPELSPPPKLNIVIQIIGSRGDIQPFLALALALVSNPPYHRVRIATHPTFRDFVLSVHPAIEFFSVGGDPKELMSYMTKNPGLMPGKESLRSGDIPKRRKGMYEIMKGCWRSCIDATDNTGEPYGGLPRPSEQPRSFIADAIIANPPSFAHLHCAEKLGIPCHLMFTMPWSPTQAFSHPLANITATDVPTPLTNFMSYALVEMMTWQGLGDLVNRFRETHLHLEPVSTMWAPGMIPRLKVPYTYCWSPALIPKPLDWGGHISISGFYFLDLASSFTPPTDLMAFLQPPTADPRPIVYIGFGSIVVEDPDALTAMIFEAVRTAGVRALVSKGWGGLGGSVLAENNDTFLLGNVPHDWLFKFVTAVVHHGGAGTTAAGIRAGKPTFVVPFFGDQPFWGAMVHKAGAGPTPIPFKKLNASNLAESIKFACSASAIQRAEALGESIKNENGFAEGKRSFEEMLDVACDALYDGEQKEVHPISAALTSIHDVARSASYSGSHQGPTHIGRPNPSKPHASSFGSKMRCMICHDRVAVWRLKRTSIRLSALAATILGNAGFLRIDDLKLIRHKEWDTETGPWEPISGGASALLGTIGSIMMGVGDMPREVFRGIKKSSKEASDAQKLSHTPSSQSQHGPSSAQPSSSALTLALKAEKEKQDSENVQTATSVLSPVSTAESAMTTVTSTDSLSLNSTVRELSYTASPGAQTPSSSLYAPSESIESGLKESHHHKKLRKEKPLDDGNDSCPAELTLGAVAGAGKGVGKIVQAGLRSPMDFTLGLAQGFHNAPRLYGDKVRKPEKVSGITSGLKAAGKGFGLGMYDGISGFFTEPVKGAMQEGPAGFLKGFGRGIGGIVLKPGAAIWGVPGYTFKGIYEEFRKFGGHDENAYILSMRVQQGYEELSEAKPEEEGEILAKWAKMDLEKETQGSRKKRRAEKEKATRSMTTVYGSGAGGVGTPGTPPRSQSPVLGTPPSPSFGSEEWEAGRLRQGKGRKGAPKKKGKTFEFFKHTVEAALAGSPRDRSALGGSEWTSTSSLPTGTLDEDAEFEKAIKESVRRTSRGDPEQDRMIERAIRASVAELRKPTDPEKANLEQSDDEDDALKRAIRASIAEAKKDGAPEDEAFLHEAITDGLQTQAAIASGHGPPPLPDRSSVALPGHDGLVDNSGEDWPDTEEDEELKRVLAESQRQHMHDEAQRKGRGHSDDSDPDLRLAMEESQRSMQSSHLPPPYELSGGVGPSASDLQVRGTASQVAQTQDREDSDPDLTAALAASHVEETERRKREEEEEQQMLELAKKASLSET